MLTFRLSAVKIYGAIISLFTLMIITATFYVCSGNCAVDMIFRSLKKSGDINSELLEYQTDMVNEDSYISKCLTFSYKMSKRQFDEVYKDILLFVSDNNFDMLYDSVDEVDAKIVKIIRFDSWDRDSSDIIQKLLTLDSNNTFVKYYTTDVEDEYKSLNNDVIELENQRLMVSELIGAVEDSSPFEHSLQVIDEKLESYKERQKEMEERRNKTVYEICIYVV